MLHALRLLIVGFVVACRTFAFAASPNVLFIAVDDLRPELGCYGSDVVLSPNLDRLAESGVVFERAYCQQAVCNPSRASIMTGLRPDSTRVWDLVTDLRKVRPNVVTMPQHFKEHGYHTVGMGKIYHNTFPDPQSWSVPKPQPKRTRLYSPKALAKLRERRAAARKAGVSEERIWGAFRGPATDAEDVPDNARFDGALTDLALDQLREVAERDDPFFLGVGYILPHLPWTPPKKYWDLYDREKLPLAENPFLPKDAPAWAMFGQYELRAYMDFSDAAEPPAQIDEARQRRLKHGYYASVSFIDTQIGRLLDELERLELDDETIVVLWGDHGWKLGEHGSWCKQTNYEDDTHVPLLFRVPGSKANGKRTSALVEFVDVYPTLCELAGLPVPEELEGRSLVPLLDDPSRPWATAAFSQFRRRRPGGKEFMGYAMRTDRYRYVEWIDRTSQKVVGRELYDHSTDPRENENVAGRPANGELIDRLSKQLWKALPAPPKWPLETSAEVESPQASGKKYVVTKPPAEMKLPDFYDKHVSASGYPIVSSGKVNDYALKEAAYLVDLMLAKRPDVRKAMVKSGSRLIVMAHDEYTSDVPEHAHLEPNDWWDARARGLGGSKTDPVCSCGEENLLAFEGDPYSTESILIHEFAHNIHLRGMVNVDPTFDERLKRAYDDAMKAGLWKGVYASTNKNEYFAEGVQSWFDNNRQPDHDHNHVDTRKELKEYDPALADLCAEVFGETKLVYTKPTTRLTGHLAGYDPKSAPKFVWPEKLRKLKEEIRAEARERKRKANEKPEGGTEE